MAFNTLIYLGMFLPLVRCGYNRLYETSCSHPADVVFLLDCSGSLRRDEFYEQLNFMRNFVSEADVSRNVVRVSLVTFSTYPRTEFFLKDYRTKRDVMAAISRTRYRGGRTHTWTALDYIRKYSFSPKFGSRPGVPKILIVITDGGSNERYKTIRSARLMKTRKIRTYAIGIGNQLNYEELVNLASKSSFIFHVPNSHSLKKIQNDVRRNVCRSVCDIWPADIVFLLDDSTSIWDNDYQKQLTFLSDFVKDITIGPKKSQISVVTFSSRPKTQFWLRDHLSKTAVLSAIKHIDRMYGDTYTADGLRMIREHSFSPRYGGRIKASHIVIVVTDGKSTIPTETVNQAKKLHDTKAIVFAIGVGRRVDPIELNNIASERQFVFQVDSYDALTTIKTKLSQKVCTLSITRVGEWD
ncbi:collagen alpha-1(XIV) chain isoform X1 [Octopus bimaculoides]|uniref:VWFA domain-containing protein n=2 Tax=Octopus bimaculoides TaxID=37653 RepID=A0A0L8FQX5_OCTBM|nr:collagen alpha-1(XIV) chain isoform X1 [Octopus bimaculoides]|eukprot:XP_014787735.1 PREDICTED: collagen alpha-1(XIV) chain-like [Octopus bimaculoides]